MHKPLNNFKLVDETVMKFVVASAPNGEIDNTRRDSLRSNF